MMESHTEESHTNRTANNCLLLSCICLSKMGCDEFAMRSGQALRVNFSVTFNEVQFLMSQDSTRYEMIGDRGTSGAGSIPV